MKRNFRFFCILLLMLVFVVSSCTVPAVSTDRQSASMSEERELDSPPLVVAYFQTAQELAQNFYRSSYS